MTYAIPLLTLVMLAYMYWATVFRLRRDRLRATRRSDRSGIIASPRRRVRSSLTRAFEIPARRPEWEADLLGRLQARDGE